MCQGCDIRMAAVARQEDISWLTLQSGYRLERLWKTAASGVTTRVTFQECRNLLSPSARPRMQCEVPLKQSPIPRPSIRIEFFRLPEDAAARERKLSRE